MHLDCFECGEPVTADELSVLADRFLAHAREHHAWPYPDQGIRNYAEATQRLTGPSERVPTLGTVAVHPVDEARLDDWAELFDQRAFVGRPEWAACYCLEPHVATPDASHDEDVPHWRANRAAMQARLRDGRAHGYLATVDERPAGWVNASWRHDYTLHPGEGDDPPGTQVIGISCFVIAPPYRGHGLASVLLDRVIEDAEDRGAAWLEAYPFDETVESDRDFRGPRAMYDARGFAPVRVRARDTVVRRPVRVTP